MRYETLEAIHTLLRKDYEQKRDMNDFYKEKLKVLQYDSEKYKVMLDLSFANIDREEKARRALEDFELHEFR